MCGSLFMYSGVINVLFSINRQHTAFFKCQDSAVAGALPKLSGDCGTLFFYSDEQDIHLFNGTILSHLSMNLE